MSKANPYKVAIVDDDDGVRDSTSILLESFGYRTEVFASAEAFLASPFIAEADCLLLDVQMPGMTGIELLEHLRTSNVRTPAILMTANVERIGRRGTDAGAFAIVRKPFAEDEIEHRIREACDPTRIDG